MGPKLAAEHLIEVKMNEALSIRNFNVILHAPPRSLIYLASFTVGLADAILHPSRPVHSS